MLQPQSDSDPLLEFSSEPGATPASPPPGSQPAEPVAAPAVSAPPPTDPTPSDDVPALRARIDCLEKALEQSASDVRKLKSEVATLVGVAADIRRGAGRAGVATPAPPASMRRWLRAALAIAGVFAGIVAGAWFWIATGHEQLAPRVASRTADGLQPETATVDVGAEPQRQQPETETAAPAIVPVAAVTPVSDTPARVAPRPVTYVGTLSIDASPGGDVFIDRKPAGRTPLRAENLKAGSHLVWIQRDGYRRFTRVVRVPADRVTRLVADLEPAER